MIIHIPTIINELRENATEEQCKGLSILDSGFYECIELKKKLDIAVEALGYYAQCKHINLDLVTIREGCAEFEAFEDGEHARKALKEMEEE